MRTTMIIRAHACVCDFFATTLLHLSVDGVALVVQENGPLPIGRPDLNPIVCQRSASYPSYRVSRIL